MSTVSGTGPTGWSLVADGLAQAGVHCVFGLPEDELVSCDALAAAGIRLVACREQRTAVFMATGYALCSGDVGVCVVGGGPAVTNTLTGLLEAAAQGAPVVLIVAGTPAAARGTGAFQELDPQPMVRPLVRSFRRVESGSVLAAEVERAVVVATNEGGPVCLEIPTDVAAAPVARTPPWSFDVDRPQPSGGWELALPDVVARHGRRVVLVGGGMRGRHEDRVVERLATALGAALVTTASGRGVVDEEHDLACGLAGLYAEEPAAGLLRSADVVVSLGSALEETVRTGWLDVADPPTVVQVDRAATGFSVAVTGPRVLGDGRAVAAAWLQRLRAHPLATDDAWLAEIARTRAVLVARADEARSCMARSPQLHVAEVLAALRPLLPDDAVVAHENGLADMWSYFWAYWRHGPAHSVIAPSEQTSLGFGAAAAAGAAVATGRTAVAIVGDGAWGTLAADLPTLEAEGMPVCHVVLHNGGYGWLAAQLAPEDLEQRVRLLQPVGNAITTAQASGRQTFVVDRKGALASTLRAALAATADGPVAVHVPVRLDDVHPAVRPLLRVPRSHAATHSPDEASKEQACADVSSV